MGTVGHQFGSASDDLSELPRYNRAQPAPAVGKGQAGGEMKILLAIFSCHLYQYAAAGERDWFTRTTVDRIQGIRDSWLKDVTGDYKIFKGRSAGTPPPNEIWLDAGDDYHHSTEKIRKVIRYALDQGYDYICKVDDDVCVYYDRLMENIPTSDYVGGGLGWEVASFSPGYTYWLSHRAMELLDKSPAGCWGEDRWVGEALMRQRIRCTIDNRYHLVKPTRTNQYISDAELDRPNGWLTIHSLSPDQMRRHYASLHGDPVGQV